MLRYLRFENVHTDIFTPRTYQVELLYKAIQRNTIVCLGGGAGKTFISVLLIKELAHQLRKPLHDGGKRTIYLVQKVASAEYRAKALVLHTDLKVTCYADEDESVNTWSHERWQNELEANQVLVMTPNTLINALQNGGIAIWQLSTLVFDSCHYVLEEDHPYGHIMEYYFKTPIERAPRVLGLTASLLNNHCKTPAELHQKLEALQDSMNSTAETASDVMLAATFGTKPKELILESDKYEDETGLVQQFESILATSLYFLETCNFGVKKPTEKESNTDQNNEKDQIDRSENESVSDENEVSNTSDQSNNACEVRSTEDAHTHVDDVSNDVIDHMGGNCSDQCEAKDACQKCLKTDKKINTCDNGRDINNIENFEEEKSGTTDDGGSHENDVKPSSETRTDEDEQEEWQLRDLEEDEEVIRVPRIALMECYNILHLLGPWCAGRVAETLAKQVEKLLEIEKDDWTKRFLHFTHTQLNLISHMMTETFDYDVIDLEDFQRYVSPKVKKLLETFYDYKPNENFVIIAGDNIEDMDQSDNDSMMSDDDMNEDLASDAGSDDVRIRGSVDPNTVHYVAKKMSDDPAEKENKEESLCGLVFVERRHTAFILNKLLEEMCNWDPDLFFVRSHHFTGQGYSRGSKPKECDMFAYKKQEEVLRKFRHREYNVLVSTAVLEEGLDIPRCNLVVRFDLPQNYRSYVASKGRARATNSKFFMLVDEEEKAKFDEDLDSFKGFEKLMCHALQELDEERDEELPADLDSLLPPYASSDEEGAAKITLSSAIALVNRYCAKLPSDAFTHLVPDCSTEQTPQNDGSVKYRCTLQLPINSPVKRPIQGEEMESRKLAKMAVALKTCEVLHKEGEIDDQFLPIGKEMIRYEDEDNEWEETEGQARPGTTKRKQYYLKKIANDILGRPQADKPCYMYVFNMKLTCPITEEQNTRGRQIYAPENSPRGFGFISEGKIPLVPEFPVFTRSGEVTVSIDLVRDSVTFSREELARFECFHRFVFSRVLRLDKDPMTYMPSEAPYSCIVIPVLSGKDKIRDVNIDWKFIEKIEACPTKGKFVYKKRDPKEKFVYRQEDFADAVVMPSYRNIDQPQYFYVAETRTDINPKSPFPSPELFDTFHHYYCTKYGLEITNMEQPLLDVDHTSARLNLLTPRYMNQKGVALPTSSAETRRQKRENLQQKQILVPELCDIHPFPASLWRKAVCIPAMFYRLNYLLIADEIRILIANHAKIGVALLPYDHRFSQLEFNFPQKPGDESPHSSVSKENSSSSSSQESSAAQQSLMEESDRHTPSSNENGNEAKTNDIRNEVENQNGSKQESATNNPAQGHMSHSGSASSAQANSEISKTKDCDINSDPSQTGNERFTAEENSSHVSVNPSTCEDVEVQKSCLVSKNMESGDVAVSAEADDDLIVKHDVNKTDEIATKVDDVNTNSDTSGASSKSQSFQPISAQSIYSSASEKHLDNPTKQANTSPPGHMQETDPVETSTQGSDFMSFDDEDIDLEGFIGPSPCLILQTLTMSNANDFFNLERLETIGDSFLKFAITVYLYCTYPGIHEGKLSYLRSKQVSNYNLYRLGKKTGFPECMVASKFEPSENWLPPGFVIKQAGAFRGLEVFVASSADLNTKKRSECHYVDNPGKVSEVRGEIKKWEDMTFADVDEELPVVVRAETISENNTLISEVTEEEVRAFDSEEFQKIENLTISEIDDEVMQGNVQSTSERNDVLKSQSESEKCHSSHNACDIGKASTQVQQGQVNGMVKLLPADKRAGNEEDNLYNALREISSDSTTSNQKAAEIDSDEQQVKFQQELEQFCDDEQDKGTDAKTLIPYNLQTQHSLPDKSIADCVEALIGCYLVTCGQRAALQFMAWLGLKVLPDFINQKPEIDKKKSPFCGFQRPPSPLLTHVPNAHGKLLFFLDGYEAFEERIDYEFADKSYLLQAFTHASYHYNNITDCYQRLEFLGDAILDYVITRHLFEDSKKHSPGILTDLRSALVNNNIFAALAVKWDFHKYFKAVSPHLFNVINKFVQWQKERGDVISLEEEFGEKEESTDEGEDIEIPKALGDIFESIAGAIYLDSGMSLDVVWRVYYRMMKPYIDAFTEKIPKSPVRELLEMEPETAKFERPERTMDGKIRVTVTVVGKGSFRGVGRNYRIAKSAAAKRALKHIKLYQLEVDKEMTRQMYMAAMLAENMQ